MPILIVFIKRVGDHPEKNALSPASREAQVALAAALEEARNSGASHYVSMAQRNLARVDAAIARLGC